MSLGTIRTLYAHHWWANRTLRESDLERTIPFRLLSGKEYAQPLDLVLHHVTDHGTHHRSEIATMLTLVSGSPPDTGLARFIAIRSGQDRA
jgi:uncharacterized damage-inducible protein DinB